MLQVSLYLFQTLLAASIFCKGPITLSTSRGCALIFCLVSILTATRLSALFWRCREEHLGQPCEESLLQKNPSDPESWGLERVLVASGCALLLTWCAWPPRSSNGLAGALTRVGLMVATGALLAHWFVQLKPPATIQNVLGSHQELLPNTAMLVSIALALLGWAMPCSPMGIVSLLPASALLFLLTLAGESYAVPLCMMVAALWGLSHLWSSWPSTDLWGPLLCWLLIGQLGFFSTGHQASFSTIHWKAAFVGAPIDRSPMILGAIKVLLNTFAGPLVAGASLPLLQHSFHTQGVSSTKKQIMPFVAYCALLLLQVCSTMASCLLLRRHLMVWTIFAPRLVFQVLSAFFGIVAVFIGWVSSQRIVSRAEVFHID